MNKHFIQDGANEEHTKYNRIQVYPAKDPTKSYTMKNDKGETYDFYYIVDTYKTWRIKPRGWKRVIKNMKDERIDHLKNLDQYDKDVLAYIKTNYPLPR